MTTKEKFINFLRQQSQLTEDRWGNFKTSSGKIRYKINATSVRKEIKVNYGSGWFRKWTAYYSKIDISNGKIKR